MKVQLVLLSLALCLAAVSALSLREAQNEFVAFQRKYNKVYDASEFQHRFNIFRRNLEDAAQWQRQNPKARFGATQFSDLSPEEFRKFYLMPKGMINKLRSNRAPVKTDFSKKTTSQNYPMGPDPSNWDWFQQGVCTGVYDQGQCGSCWAFSATETIESYFAIAGNQLTGLSMEQIVDCDTTDYGCNGGIPTNAYAYVQSAGGIDSGANYPYIAGGGQAQSCQFPQGSTVTNVASYNSVDGEQGLYNQVSTQGPVSVCVDATTWQSYQGGVISTCTSNIDHCVQLTGYANANGGINNGGYWIVRNSWGTGWGESGFIWVDQGSDLCAIGDEASVAFTQ